MDISFAPGIRRGVITFALLTLVAASASAQNVGTITGSVKDQQGLAVPGATVTLVNRISQANQNAVTDEQGRFTLNNVAYGTYVLNVSLEGFTPVEQVIEIRSTVPVAREIQLKVGGVQETVTVSADALLETSSTGSHVDLGASLIDQLPTSTPSKQLSAMLLSAPGFIPSQNGRIHVRGSHGQIQYVVDGVPLTDEFTEAFANPLDPRYVKSAEVMTDAVAALGGGKLAAVVGPGIGPCCYEVGGEVAAPFRAAGWPVSRIDAWFTRRDTLRLDLWQATRDQLVDAGVQPHQVYMSGLCTACQASLFYSYRREGAATGRIVGYIRRPTQSQ